MVDSNQTTCVENSVDEGDKICIILNASILLILFIPAVVLNISLITQYCRFRPPEKRSLANFLIFHQAISNLCHVVLICPGLIVGSLVFYTDVFEQLNLEGSIANSVENHAERDLILGADASNTKEQICRFWYMSIEFLMTTSFIGRLLAFISSSLLHFFLPVWKPLFWHRHFYQRTKRWSIIMASAWMASIIFAAGEPITHYDWEFHHRPGEVFLEI